jgi:predicted flap endonuclease-1-like 5' DNA nuclease
MAYVLTLGWPWFAAACALGALIGYVTASPAKDSPSAPGWNIVAVAAALAGGAAASWLDLVEGRAALTLDIFLVAAFAYLIGLPIGGAFKQVQGSAPAHATKRPTLVLRGVMAEISEPAVAPPAEPQADIAATAEPVTPISVEPALAAAASGAKALNEKAAQMRAPRGGAAGGAPPATLPAPRGGAADDLAKIKGLGPKSVEKLHALGVFHYDQIAAWSDDNVKWIESSIGAAGRVTRSGWVAQARTLNGVADRSADAA